MKHIFKYPLDGRNQVIDCAKGIKFLSVQMQDGIPCIWGEFDANETKTVSARFAIVGTGMDLDIGDMKYLGTCQHNSRAFHVYIQTRGK